jgi:hypothetical protein
VTCSGADNCETGAWDRNTKGIEREKGWQRSACTELGS